MGPFQRQTCSIALRLQAIFKKQYPEITVADVVNDKAIIPSRQPPMRRPCRPILMSWVSEAPTATAAREQPSRFAISAGRAEKVKIIAMDRNNSSAARR